MTKHRSTPVHGREGRPPLEWSGSRPSATYTAGTMPFFLALLACSTPPPACHQRGTATLVLTVHGRDPDDPFQIRDASVVDCLGVETSVTEATALATPSVGVLQVHVRASWSTSSSDTGSGVSYTESCAGTAEVDPPADGAVVPVDILVNDCWEHWSD